MCFWYFSIAGSIILLSYAIKRLDPVFIAGQSIGILIYTSNLALIKRERLREAASEESAPAKEGGRVVRDFST